MLKSKTTEQQKWQNQKEFKMILVLRLFLYYQIDDELIALENKQWLNRKKIFTIHCDCL